MLKLSKLNSLCSLKGSSCSIRSIQNRNLNNPLNFNEVETESTQHLALQQNTFSGGSVALVVALDVLPQHFGGCGDLQMVFLPTAREGNVFTPVCQMEGGVRADPLGGRPPWKQTPLVLISSGGHCSSWYASYWNAFSCECSLSSYCSYFRVDTQTLPAVNKFV